MDKLDIKTRVALISMNSEMGDPDANLKKITGWMQEAHSKGATFAIFNEESITGSMNKSDLSFSEADRIAKYASKITKSFLEPVCSDLNMTAIVGSIEPAGDRFLNSALTIGPDGYLNTYSKLHLPNENEKKWFSLGPSLPVVRSQGWTFGVGICFDVRFPEIFRAAALNGAEMFFLLVGGSLKVSNSENSRVQSKAAKLLLKDTMKLLPSRAIDNGMYVLFANQAGHSGNAWFPGYSLGVSPDGDIVGEHSTGKEGMVVLEVSKKAVEEAKSSPRCTVDMIRPSIYNNPLIVADAS